MLRPGGYSTLITPDGPTVEADTFTCAHCNKVVEVPPRADVNFISMCRCCMKPICNSPRCNNFACDPIEKKLDRAEKGGSFFL